MRSAVLLELGIIRRADGVMRKGLRLIHDHLDGSVAAQGFGIGAVFVRLVHDALRLSAIDAWELRVKLHRQAVAALVILDQA